MRRFFFTTILSFFGLFLFAQTAPKGADLSVYPNPASETISIMDANQVIASFEVYNLVGKKVKSFDFRHEESYDIADLPKGMYLVRIFDKNGLVLTTKKFDKR